MERPRSWPVPIGSRCPKKPPENSGRFAEFRSLRNVGSEGDLPIAGLQGTTFALP